MWNTDNDDDNIEYAHLLDAKQIFAIYLLDVSLFCVHCVHTYVHALGKPA